MEVVETDILIVGSGAGALTAACVAADFGAQVIVVEKAALMGGTSATSGCAIWVPCSPHLKEIGVSDTPEEAFAYIKALTAGSVSDAKIRAYVEHAPKMLSYMEEKTEVKYRPIQYADYHPELPGSKPGYRTHEAMPISADLLGADYERIRPIHPIAQLLGRVNWTMLESMPLITKKPGWLMTMITVLGRYYLDIPMRLKTPRDRRVTNGNAGIGRLKRSMDTRNIPLWLESPMKELVTEQGKVVGAVIERAGRSIQVRARRGVILGAGGFERNREMRKTYLGLDTDGEDSGSNAQNTGDAIRAGMAIGAKIDLMDAAWWAPSYHFPGDTYSYPMFAERALPGSLIVNGRGERYMNEAASYYDTGLIMRDLAVKGEPTNPSYLIFDAAWHSRYPLGPIMPTGSSGDKYLPEKVKAVLKSAPTLAALAPMIGADPKTLESTVARFNGFCETGKDLDFHRGESIYDQYYGDHHFAPNTCLGKLDKPLFYALPLHIGDIGTKGGLLTDENARVLSESDTPIPGLYAIGNTAASVMGRSYPGAGATIGPAMTFGYLAARHAMGANT